MACLLLEKSLLLRENSIFETLVNFYYSLYRTDVIATNSNIGEFNVRVVIISYNFQKLKWNIL